MPILYFLRHHKCITVQYSTRSGTRTCTACNKQKQNQKIDDRELVQYASRLTTITCTRYQKSTSVRTNKQYFIPQQSTECYYSSTL